MQLRRPRFVPAVMVTMALLGAACADDDDDDTSTGEDGEEVEAGALGAVEIAPDDPIVIGSLQAVSGDTASLGTDQVRAIEIAIAEQGEILGHEIELVEQDDECSAEGGTAGATALVAEPQMVAVLGTSCSGAAVPAADILQDEGIAMVSGSNTSPALTSDLEGTEGSDHQDIYFRISHNDVIQGQAAASFAYDELGARTAVTIHDGDPYTNGLATAFETSFEELGGEVVLATQVGPEDTNMRPVLTEAAATNPDMVFFPIFQPAADFIVAQSNEFPELEDTAKLMGADGLLSDTFISIADTENMYFSGPATPQGSAYEDLVQAYEDEYGEAPIQAFHAHSYDAANVLFAAIEEAAVEGDDGSLTIDRQALLDALHATEGFEGVTGTLTCDEFGDCADAAIDVVQNTEAQVAIADVRSNILFTYEPEE